MIYLDTSFLLPLFRQEAVSESVGKVLAARARGSLAISHWTRVEFTSVIAREVRIRAIGEAAAHKLIGAFDVLVHESFHMLVPTLADFDLARDFVANFSTKLRGPDALHLAIARNNEIEEVLTLDSWLLAAAKILRIRAGRGIRSRQGKSRTRAPPSPPRPILKT